MSKKVKIFAIVVAGIVVIIIAASLVSGKKTPPKQASNSPLSTSAGIAPLPGMAQPSTNSDEFSSLLSSIKRITIDTSLFDNKAYKLLRDYPVSLGSEIVGRTNPFAPIGSDVNGVDFQQPIIQTIQPGKIRSTSAELGAQITLTDTVPTSVIFEYGKTDTFGSVTTPVIVNKKTTTLVTISNLIPDTLYYVRAVAVRGSATTIGNTTSFTTTKK